MACLMKLQTNIVLVISHIKNHHEKKQCTDCGKMFADVKMKCHIFSKHRAISDRPLKCEFCGKGFIFKKQLQEHLNIHTGEKPHLCKFCGAAFNATGSRHNHERLVHLNKRRDTKNLSKKDAVKENVS